MGPYQHCVTSHRSHLTCIRNPGLLVLNHLHRVKQGESTCHLPCFFCYDGPRTHPYISTWKRKGNARGQGVACREVTRCALEAFSVRSYLQIISLSCFSQTFCKRKYNVITHNIETSYVALSILSSTHFGGSQEKKRVYGICLGKTLNYHKVALISFVQWNEINEKHQIFPPELLLFSKSC